MSCYMWVSSYDLKSTTQWSISLLFWPTTLSIHTTLPVSFWKCFAFLHFLSVHWALSRNKMFGKHSGRKLLFLIFPRCLHSRQKCTCHCLYTYELSADLWRTGEKVTLPQGIAIAGCHVFEWSHCRLFFFPALSWAGVGSVCTRTHGLASCQFTECITSKTWIVSWCGCTCIHCGLG